MRKAKAIELDDAQRKKLMKLAHSNTAQVRLARRAGIVLLAADGLDNHEIGEMLDVGRVQAGRWRAWYAVGGVKAIAQDLPRGGRKPKIDPAEIVIWRCEQRHRHVEWPTFLRQIDRETPQDKALHLVCDNCATHKHPNAKE